MDFVLLARASEPPRFDFLEFLFPCSDTLETDVDPADVGGVELVELLGQGRKLTCPTMQVISNPAALDRPLTPLSC